MKKKTIQGIEARLAEKYTPSFFKDNLEGRTINMDPVNIAVDKEL